MTCKRCQHKRYKTIYTGRNPQSKTCSAYARWECGVTGYLIEMEQKPLKKGEMPQPKCPNFLEQTWDKDLPKRG